jgi:hypothetical protein
MNPKLFQETQLYDFLGRADEDLAAKTHSEGCPCDGVLHRADYPRKPRGGPSGGAWRRRRSFCCNREGCRRRHTPPSVRFLGRKVYVSVVVVLVGAMMHGISRRRIVALRSELGVDERTLWRWRQWWRERFVQTAFWRTARALLIPPVEAGRLPGSLVDRFDGWRVEGLVGLLRFLSPVTVTSRGEAAMGS